jgi:predicted TPR repeat methyltransferase
MEHAVCTGVMNLVSDLSPVFAETARILRRGGLFAFVVGDRAEGEAYEVEVGPEHTKSERTVMMYRHSPEQIDTWLGRYGFDHLRSLAFTVFMDRERTRSLPARAYLVPEMTGN